MLCEIQFFLLVRLITKEHIGKLISFVLQYLIKLF